VAPGSSCDVQGLARSGSRCGSLVSPAPSSTFACRQVRPRGCRSPSARSFPEGTVRANLLTFAPLQSRTVRPGRFLGLLSWVPSAHPNHVRSEMRLSPLHRHARAASTPATMINRRFGFGGSTLEVPFRPRGFSPPRRFPPLHESRACCIPLPILGSTAFLLVGVPVEDRDVPPLPRDAGPYPSKDSSPTAGARHRARCPLAVPRRSPLRLACPRCRSQVRRSGRIGSAGFEALLRRRVWCRPPPLPVGGRPAPSWASFLFKVSSLRPEIPSPTAVARRVAWPGRPGRVVASSELRSAPVRRRSGDGRHAAPKRALAETAPDGSVSGAAVAHDPKTAAAGGQRVAT